MRLSRLVFSRFLLVTCVVLAVVDAAHGAEVGKDHPLISRFTGATLEAFKIVEFDEATVVAQPLPNQDKPAPGALLKLEGRISHNGYVIKGDKSALEVMRNYELALAQGGFQTLFQCSERAGCGEDIARFIINSHKMAPGGFPSSFNVNSRYILARRETPQGVVHAAIYVMQDSSNNRVCVYQEVIESKPMATGQVQVASAAALKQGLDAEGKVAVYGIYFDSAAADIKPESKPTLDEMARLLTNNKPMKVYIVGHTDNTGTLAANLDLSQRRADAVVKALVGMKVDAAQLVPKGVASLAPVASNSADSGRAKNRRVELVLQ
jgi:outer membrane protein OmpA-like peptidoglycan-associated protein